MGRRGGEKSTPGWERRGTPQKKSNHDFLMASAVAQQQERDKERGLLAPIADWAWEGGGEVGRERRVLGKGHRITRIAR